MVKKILLIVLIFVLMVPLVHCFAAVPSDPASIPDQISKLVKTGVNEALNVLNDLLSYLTFYVFFLSLAILFVFVGLRWAMLRHQYCRFDKQLEEKKGEKSAELNNRDWWVVQHLRKRALNLHMRADLILVSMCALLLFGIYLILFGLAEVSKIDEDVFTTRLIKFKFGDELQALVDGDGRRWLKINKKEGKSRFAENKWPRASKGHEGFTFFTKDSGQNWEREALFRTVSERVDPESFKANREKTVPVVRFKEGEVVIAAALSADGETAMIGGTRGSVSMKAGKDSDWKSQTVEFKEGEIVTAAALSADGETAMIAGKRGSVFMKTGKGSDWESHAVRFEKREYVTAAALSVDGETAMIGGNQGSVSMKAGKDSDWKSQTVVGFEKMEYVTAAALSADGETAMIAGKRGSVSMKAGKDSDWKSQTVEFKEGEYVIVVVLSADGKTAMIGGTRGSVSMKAGKDSDWKSQTVEFKEGEYVIVVVLSADGKTGLVIGEKGSAFRTFDGGKDWDRLNLDLRSGEYPLSAFVFKDKKTAMFIGIRGSVFLQMNEAEASTPTSISLTKYWENPTTAAFSKDGKTGVVAIDEGSVFITTDKGKQWDKKELNLRREEEFTSATFSQDGQTGVIVGKRGSAFLTTDRGKTWVTTTGLDVSSRDGPHFQDDPLVSIDNGNSIAKTSSGYYILKSYPKLAGWRGWSWAQMQDAMEKDYLKGSDLFLRMLSTAEDAIASNAVANTKEKLNEGDQSSKPVWADFLTDLTVKRIATLAILFFLVQVLVRLNQYSLRMASFWDSRADAILLASSFSDSKAKNFDDLVSALAPDTYDFKAPPSSLLDRLPSWGKS